MGKFQSILKVLFENEIYDTEREVIRRRQESLVSFVRETKDEIEKIKDLLRKDKTPKPKGLILSAFLEKFQNVLSEENFIILETRKKGITQFQIQLRNYPLNGYSGLLNLNAGLSTSWEEFSSDPRNTFFYSDSSLESIAEKLEAQAQLEEHLTESKITITEEPLE